MVDTVPSNSLYRQIVFLMRLVFLVHSVFRNFLLKVRIWGSLAYWRGVLERLKTGQLVLIRLKAWLQNPIKD